jgi:hypothetical protein
MWAVTVLLTKDKATISLKELIGLGAEAHACNSNY